MKVNIERHFEVEYSKDLVWKNFMDPMGLAECIPGCVMEEKVSDTQYKGKLDLKFGPVNANYKAELIYEALDKNQNNLTVLAKGVDTRGGGSADMRLKGTLSEIDSSKTKVDGDVEIIINGKIAQFGSRLVFDASNQLFDQFVANFKKKLGNIDLTEGDRKLSIGKIINQVVKHMFASLIGVFRKKSGSSQEST